MYLFAPAFSVDWIHKYRQRQRGRCVAVSLAQLMSQCKIGFCGVTTTNLHTTVITISCFVRRWIVMASLKNPFWSENWFFAILSVAADGGSRSLQNKILWPGRI